MLSFLFYAPLFSLRYSKTSSSFSRSAGFQDRSYSSRIYSRQFPGPGDVINVQYDRPDATIQTVTAVNSESPLSSHSDGQQAVKSSSATSAIVFLKPPPAQPEEALIRLLPSAALLGTEEFSFSSWGSDSGNLILGTVSSGWTFTYLYFSLNSIFEDRSFFAYSSFSKKQSYSQVSLYWRCEFPKFHQNRY